MCLLKSFYVYVVYKCPIATLNWNMKNNERLCLQHCMSPFLLNAIIMIRYNMISCTILQKLTMYSMKENTAMVGWLWLADYSSRLSKGVSHFIASDGVGSSLSRGRSYLKSLWVCCCVDSRQASKPSRAAGIQPVCTRSKGSQTAVWHW